MSTGNRIRICSDSPEFEKSELRFASLLTAERHHWIDAYRAPRGDITSKESDTEEKENDTGKGQRICRPHAIEQSRHQMRHDHSTNESNRSTHNGEVQSLTQNNAENVRF